VITDTIKAGKLTYYGHKETRELPGERDNARNNARCTEVRKTSHCLDGQYQQGTGLSVEVNQNDRGQG